MVKVLSLGAGVQSTTLALMAAKGELGEVPDCAIFSDTGWEPKAVYEHLEKLILALPFPVYIVSAGNIRENLINGLNARGKQFDDVPWFRVHINGKKNLGKRQCTADYKIRPIQIKVVELMDGKRPKGGCEMWIGISMDEIIRMKPSRVQYIQHRWPLIEKGMSRNDCIKWLATNGWTAPKSSCIGCPFHSDAMWRGLTPEEFKDAVYIDEIIRSRPGKTVKQYMHRSCVPLAEVDFRTPAEMGQDDLFGNECEGMCGV